MLRHGGRLDEPPPTRASQRQTAPGRLLSHTFRDFGRVAAVGPRPGGTASCGGGQRPKEFVSPWGTCVALLSGCRLCRLRLRAGGASVDMHRRAW